MFEFIFIWEVIWQLTVFTIKLGIAIVIVTAIAAVWVLTIGIGLAMRKSPSESARWLMANYREAESLILKQRKV